MTPAPAPERPCELEVTPHSLTVSMRMCRTHKTHCYADVNHRCPQEAKSLDYKAAYATLRGRLEDDEFIMKTPMVRCSRALECPTCDEDWQKLDALRAALLEGLP